MRYSFVLLLCVSAAGCPDRGLGELSPVQGRVETKDIPANPRRDIDILFLIDNSGSMKEEQDSLRANFPKFMGVLETLDGGMPNVHIGVATSDLGQSANDGGVGTGAFGGCSGKGEDGALHTSTMVNGRFIVDSNNHATKNYSGTLGEAFASLADVGTAGCGLEQHLRATERALSNPANVGFVRPEAYLGVIVIGDEDDCSLEHSALFSSTTDGTALNFKCTTDGVACDDGPDLTKPGVRNECHVKADSQYVSGVDRYVDFLKSQKADPLDVIVAGIVGDPHPFEIVKPGAQPMLKPNCPTASSGGQVAVPAVRTDEFLSGFEQRNTRATICNDDLTSGLTQIAALIKAVIADPCFEAQLLDVDPSTPEPDYDCTITDVRHIPGKADEELAVIGRCDATHSVIPCWHIEEDAVNCSYTKTDPHLKLVVERNGVVPPADVHIKASCVTTDKPSGPTP
jgi:hypothetical protein